MKKSLTIFGVGASLAVAWWSVSAMKEEKRTKTRPATFVSADKAKLDESAPVMSRPLRREAAGNGPYGSFTKPVPAAPI